MEQVLEEKIRLVRADRFACQSVARLALPKERVAKCLRIPRKTSDVEVWKHQKTGKAFYNNLMVCGSVWTCPICAVKISERRRKELKVVYDEHLKNGGHVSLLTLTFSHKKNDRLKDIIPLFTKAVSKFRSGKRYNKIREEMDIIGSVRAFEITYGNNGFHPHIHIALFYKNAVNLTYYQSKLYELWLLSCQKFGLVTNFRNGLTLENGDKANDYISKHGTSYTWGIDSELTKTHIKKGKNDSVTPFDFLRLYLDTDDKKYLNLFSEYAEALKGKTQLYWSRGLKKMYAIEDKTDEELATESQENADMLGILDLDFWKYILKHDKRAYLLDLCESLGFERAVMLLKKKGTLQESTN